MRHLREKTDIAVLWKHRGERALIPYSVARMELMTTERRALLNHLWAKDNEVDGVSRKSICLRVVLRQSRASFHPQIYGAHQKVAAPAHQNGAIGSEQGGASFPFQVAFRGGLFQVEQLRARSDRGRSWCRRGHSG